MADTTERTTAAQPLSGLREMAQAIDTVIETAQKSICVFDRNLADGGYNTAERFNRLKVFLLAGRRNRIEVVVHDTDYLERDCPRMMTLLRQFPYAISIHRALAEARRVHDAFVVADEIAYWRRFHFDHPRSEVALDDETGASLLRGRFSEIWNASEPALAATVLGL
jgi:hypothetical protein